MEDIKLDLDSGSFKFRVCGIIKQDDSILVVTNDDNDFKCLPGGHVELNEDTESAVIREMKEETGLDVEIVDLLCIMQNFFKRKDGKPFHEFAYYYIVKIKNNKKIKNFEVIENDKGELKKLKFELVKIEDLDKINFKPKKIAKLIKENKINQHIINRY